MDALSDLLRVVRFSGSFFLEAKFRGLCAPILDTHRIDALIDACWRLDAMKQAGDLGPMTVPKSAPTAKTRDRAA